MKKPALLLDRDGTLIPDMGYPRSLEGVHLLDGAAAGLKAAQRLGYSLVIVSNQSGIGRGLISPEVAAAVDNAFMYLLAPEHIDIAGVYYCPHRPEEGCICRKPRPGLLLRAAVELDLDLPQSVVIGDKLSDLQAGQAAGCQGGFRLTVARSRAGDTSNSGTWEDAISWLRLAEKRFIR